LTLIPNSLVCTLRHYCSVRIIEFLNVSSQRLYVFVFFCPPTHVYLYICLERSLEGVSCCRCVAPWTLCSYWGVGLGPRAFRFPSPSPDSAQHQHLETIPPYFPPSQGGSDHTPPHIIWFIYFLYSSSTRSHLQSLCSEPSPTTGGPFSSPGSCTAAGKTCGPRRDSNHKN